MKKSILNIGKALNKVEQKTVNGGGRAFCYPGTDGICCGTAHWQCGVGPASGGFYNPGNGTCDCV